MNPVLQLALDYPDLKRAMILAREAVAGGIDWLEIGTPLIKSEGLNAVRQIRAAFPNLTLVADMKVADAGRLETECAAKSGADIISVLGTASDATIRECVEASVRYNCRISVDLLGLGSIEQMIERAGAVEAMGVFAVCVHTPIDKQMQGRLALDDVAAISKAVSIPVAAAGGIHSESAADAVSCGASIVIVGGAITKAPDARAATQTLKRVISSGVGESTEFFKRGNLASIAETLQKVTAANVCDAMHNSGALLGIRAIVPGARAIGRALTAWTYPGDWSKSVQAIDAAEPGQIIVIDSGGVPPAVWGGKASKTCKEKGIAGVVIHGAIRDTAEIKAMGFPAFATTICPMAGEPKGKGMIDVPLILSGVTVRTGDWIVADDDGVVVIPVEKATESANRAMAVVEQEDREKTEISNGRTLGQIAELAKWDQYGRNEK